MTLLSSVALDVSRPQPLRLNAVRGVISKQPRQVGLTAGRMTRERQQLQSDQATLFLREDNTVDRILAEGHVESELQGRADERARADRRELFVTSPRNQLTT